MARQEINLLASDNAVALGTTREIRWNIGSSRPQIDAALVPTGQTRYLAIFRLRNTNGVTLSLSTLQDGGDTGGADLSSTFEASGLVKIVTSQGELIAELAGADTDEPYVWQPTNTAEVLAFINAHTQGTTYDGVLTISDGPLIPTMAHLDAEVAAWAYKAVEPSGAAYKGVVLQ